MCKKEIKKRKVIKVDHKLISQRKFNFTHETLTKQKETNLFF